ncbi:DUF1496 domain-containing protein [Pontivivens insulae]|uniref:Uncharacterized protein n=1 Tax=Pontivivens insulae TaxID=1639689 RepID=A0A2R8AD83_9RHOB|nr:uncharacterized protein DUF1496 [Pontivivens insulae]SPF30213.1 hypothetical protein POI8812_02548 [Pontivivens insulae]
MQKLSTVIAVIIALNSTQTHAQTGPAVCYFQGSAFSLGAVIRQGGLTLNCRVVNGQTGLSWGIIRQRELQYCEFADEFYSDGAELSVTADGRLSHCCQGQWQRNRVNCQERNEQ